MLRAKTVIGLFQDRYDADSAIADLEDNGYNPKDMSLVMTHTEDEVVNEEDSWGETSFAGDVGTGLAAGAVIGGIAGLLIGVGTLAIPEIGAFLIGGPLAAALGLTGTAAATVGGAVTGAVAGGLIAALMSLGLSRKEAEHYQARIREGAILLAIPTENAGEVEDILGKNNASDIKTLVADQEELRRHHHMHA